MHSTKIGYANALSLGTNSCKKKNVATLNSTHQAKKQCNFDKSDSRVVYIAPSKCCEPKIIVRCWKKVERQYIQEQQSTQFYSYKPNMDFVNGID